MQKLFNVLSVASFSSVSDVRAWVLAQDLRFKATVA